MINTLFIGSNQENAAEMEDLINQFYPNLHFFNCNLSLNDAHPATLSHKPQLIFIEVEQGPVNAFELINNLPIQDFELIFLASSDIFALEAISFNPVGYLLQPINSKQLMDAINKAIKRIAYKSNHSANNNSNNGILNNRLAIPTNEGLEFIILDDVVRFEGLQRCTQVFLKSGGRIVSSHNLGAFKNQLQTASFFLCHKSHLINLDYIKRYDKEGIIKMVDGSSVPLSRRKKTEFLDMVHRK